MSGNAKQRRRDKDVKEAIRLAADAKTIAQQNGILQTENESLKSRLQQCMHDLEERTRELQQEKELRSEAWEKHNEVHMRLTEALPQIERLSKRVTELEAMDVEARPLRDRLRRKTDENKALETENKKLRQKIHQEESTAELQNAIVSR